MALSEDSVVHFYGAILRRAPSLADVRFWTAPAARGRQVDDLKAALLGQATEVRSIARLYRGLFARWPDGLGQARPADDGLTYWTQRLRALRADEPGRPYKSILASLVGAWLSIPDVPARPQDGSGRAQWMDALSQSFLGRLPTGEERHRREGGLDQGGLTEAQVIVEMAESLQCKERMNGFIDQSLLDAAMKGEPVIAT